MAAEFGVNPLCCNRIGVNWPDIALLLTARARGASLDRTLTIGRQSLYADADGIARGYSECGMHIEPREAQDIVEAGAGFTEPLLRRLGAQHVDSLDASDFEGSTIVHDLNEPLPVALRRRYSLVYDGGSLEHVFNFPQAIRNCLGAVELGGHFITVTPANNLLGHGFYQFSPELYYRVLSPNNGFEVDLILLRETHGRARWYAVRDPEAVGQRVGSTSPWPTLMYVIARRVADNDPFMQAPQQSDYASAWADTRAPRSATTLLARVGGRLPAPARRAARLASALTGSKSGPGHFQRADLATLMDS